jgi:hypothetical protein
VPQLIIIFKLSLLLYILYSLIVVRVCLCLLGSSLPWPHSQQLSSCSTNAYTHEIDMYTIQSGHAQCRCVLTSTYHNHVIVLIIQTLYTQLHWLILTDIPVFVNTLSSLTYRYLSNALSSRWAPFTSSARNTRKFVRFLSTRPTTL